MYAIIFLKVPREKQWYLQMIINYGVNANKKYKDTLFRKLFGEDKKAALSLYNAINGSDYTNVDDLEFTTLDDVIWMKMKNDVSFMVSRTINLYEHQSSFNPNMPLRGFLYFADLYRQLIPESEKLYSRTLLKIPTPKYIVFYNGETDMKEADKLTLRLSDAFDDSSVRNDFEWTATMININYGHNSEILSRCKILEDYSKFVSLVREYQKSESLNDAINNAADDCIKNDILKKFLLKHRREVNNMTLTEFDEKKYEQVVRSDERAFLVFELVQDGDLSIDKGAKKLGMSVSDFKQAMKDNRFNIPEK